MDNPYTPSHASMDILPQPPSAGKAKLFGILGICSHVLCLLGAPFAILFGILALVRHARAKREHAEYPDAYARPHATGLVTGIVALGLLVMALPMTGIVSAIAIPALLGQREKAKIRAVESLMNNVSGELARTGDDLAARTPGRPVQAQEVVSTVLGMRNYQYPAAKNPYGGTGSPYRLGDGPAGPGEVALEPVQAFLDPMTAERHPAVVVRGQYLKNGAATVVSKVIAFD
ncbi:MAG: hypothetical protein U0P81_06535 [Holophagaceae bacterium]